MRTLVTDKQCRTIDNMLQLSKFTVVPRKVGCCLAMIFKMGNLSYVIVSFSPGLVEFSIEG